MYKKYFEPHFMPDRAQMLEIIRERIHSGLGTERVFLDAAEGRVCGEDV